MTGGCPRKPPPPRRCTTLLLPACSSRSQESSHARLVPGSAPDKGWNTEIQSAHHIDEENKIWTAEIAIDMSDFPGWDKSIIGQSMGILVSRNYKSPWQQGTWFPHGGAFVSWQLYPRVYFTENDIVTRIDDLGPEFWDARPAFEVTLFNPGPARKARVNMHIEKQHDAGCSR